MRVTFVSEHNGRVYLGVGVAALGKCSAFLWEVGRCEKKGLEHFLGSCKKAREVPINEYVKIAWEESWHKHQCTLYIRGTVAFVLGYNASLF